MTSRVTSTRDYPSLCISTIYLPSSYLLIFILAINFLFILYWLLYCQADLWFVVGLALNIYRTMMMMMMMMMMMVMILSLKITNCSFRFACLWNKLPASFLNHSPSHFSYPPTSAPCLHVTTITIHYLYSFSLQTQNQAVKHGFHYPLVGSVAQWLERRSLTGELSLAFARSVADVWPLMWV